MSFVALATCKNIPEPDLDEPVLVAALERAAVSARVLAWDDDAVDWDAPSLTVIRSTWNYYLRPDAFLDWARQRGDRLLNPAPLVAWNHHKHYLRDLDAAGLPIVPGLWFKQGSRALYGEAFAQRGWHDVVIKPCVSAGSHRTSRLKGPPFDDEAVQALVNAGDAVAQPYVTSVEAHGERSIVWIDGEITHAVRKSPRFAGEHEVISAMEPVADDERQLATAVLERKRGAGPLYARVDVMRDAAGRPMLGEVEMIEPSLFLRESPLALDRFVSAIARELRARG